MKNTHDSLGSAVLSKGQQKVWYLPLPRFQLDSSDPVLDMLRKYFSVSSKEYCEILEE